MPVKGRHILVVGGSRGLGRVLVESAVERFERVSVVARSICGSPLGSEASVHCYDADLLNKTQTRETLRQICSGGGPADALAFTQRYRGDDQVEDWQATVWATRDIIEFFEQQSESRDNLSVVVMNSIAANTVADEQSLDYHMERAALEQMVRYYAVTLGQAGIRINGITAGPYVKPESEQGYLSNNELVEMHRLLSPLNRLPTAEEICRVILFLLSEDSAFVTGQHLVVDGGISLQGHESLARRISHARDTNESH